MEEKEDTENGPQPAQISYLPYYLLGSVLQAGWSSTWMTRHYDICAIALLFNLFLQVYAFSSVLGGSRSQRFPPVNILTHLLVKLRIATSVLGIWKAWGAIDIIPPPTALEGIVNCVFFIVLALSSGPDPTLGLLLTFVLSSLALGRFHNLGWHLAFNWSAVILFMAVTLDWAFGVAVRRHLVGTRPPSSCPSPTLPARVEPAN
ncbi:unnamed protein product [Cyclocybe aegerita]|uniref:Uncharacterized protein n=1 Tax=Cyclocybe aegerita TaxID=1973307 RepID=A0A8S0WZL5_CYCAE|nr:unnamed protein product [Cyclocybe aegerita]